MESGRTRRLMNKNSCLDHRASIFPIFNGLAKETESGWEFVPELYLGTGFLIRKLGRVFLVTASHVVDPGNLLEGGVFIFYFGRPERPSGNDHCGIPNERFVHHSSADIAYAEIPDEIHERTGGEHLPLAQERLSLGQSFFAVGYPFTGKDSPTSISLEQFVFRGHVASRYPEERAIKVGINRPAEWNYVLSVDAARGLSGAPVLSDDNPERVFQVVGMVYGSRQISIGEDMHRFGIGAELAEISAIGETW